VIRAAFNQRRKTLANAVANASPLTDDKGREVFLTREDVQDALDQMGLDRTIRGEALTLEQFAEFSRNCILHTKNHMVN
jgi:16S rRNA (adenine1518-N6/adenine1519-N6)-dimethyltransferase